MRVSLRDLSIILLAIETMVVMLVPAIVIGALWYGTRWLCRKLPPLFAQARKYMAIAQFYVGRASAAIAAPLIAAHALNAQLRAWWTVLVRLWEKD